MPLQGILNTAHSLAYWTRRQEVTANNLANANTDAFKADRLTASQTASTTYPVPVRHLDLQQGSFRETARPLDLALDGKGFMVVRTPQGERLVRGGSFRLDVAGQLTDGEGNLVLGEQGPIVVNGAKVEVESDGTVRVDGADAGRLRLVQVQQDSSLLKEGFGHFACSETPAPAEPDTVRVRQGAIEEPNTDALLGMVDLVTIQRAYAANVDALKAMDSVLGAVTTEVGVVR